MRKTKSLNIFCDRGAKKELYHADCVAFYNDPDANKSCILLSNECGTGKTYGARLMCLGFIRKQESLGLKPLLPRQIAWIDLCGIIARLPKEDINQTIDAYCIIPYLFIDELKIVTLEYKKKDWQCDLLQKILDERYKNPVWTVITTNLTMNELKEQFGNRVESRLNNYTIIDFSGRKDLRKNEHKNNRY